MNLSLSLSFARSLLKLCRGCKKPRCRSYAAEQNVFFNGLLEGKTNWNRFSWRQLLSFDSSDPGKNDDDDDDDDDEDECNRSKLCLTSSAKYPEPSGSEQLLQKQPSGIQKSLYL